MNISQLKLRGEEHDDDDDDDDDDNNNNNNNNNNVLALQGDCNIIIISKFVNIFTEL